ncbi:MAG: hypothetical protein SPL83_06075 [Succinivibrio sp.]|nr:hypothetical protein [Succinivibrio sp.]
MATLNLSLEVSDIQISTLTLKANEYRKLNTEIENAKELASKFFDRVSLSLKSDINKELNEKQMAYLDAVNMIVTAQKIEDKITDAVLNLGKEPETKKPTDDTNDKHDQDKGTPVKSVKTPKATAKEAKKTATEPVKDVPVKDPVEKKADGACDPGSSVSKAVKAAALKVIHSTDPQWLWSVHQLAYNQIKNIPASFDIGVLEDLAACRAWELLKDKEETVLEGVNFNAQYFDKQEGFKCCRGLVRTGPQLKSAMAFKALHSICVNYYQFNSKGISFASKFISYCNYAIKLIDDENDRSLVLAEADRLKKAFIDNCRAKEQESLINETK